MGAGTRSRSAVTIRHVAREAGVTAMTVSNVINNKAGSAAPDTRARVLAAIERLGYRPNATALRLRTKRQNAIGMLVLDDAPDYLSDPFTTNLIAGLSDFATDHGLSLVVQGARSHCINRGPLLSHLQTDGICVLLSGRGEHREALLAKLAELRLPLVLFQESPREGDVCTIRQDDREGGRAVARHVIAGGARRLMLLLPTVEWTAMVERECGAREVAGAHEAALDVVRCGDEGIDATSLALRRAIERSGLPDAVLGGNDRMAIAALKVLAELGVAVPACVQVTGFNGFESSRYPSPELTTVRSAAYDIGWRGGAALLHRVAHGSFAGREILLPVAFVPRGSA